MTAIEVKRIEHGVEKEQPEQTTVVESRPEAGGALELARRIAHGKKRELEQEGVENAAATEAVAEEIKPQDSVVGGAREEQQTEIPDAEVTEPSAEQKNDGAVVQDNAGFRMVYTVRNGDGTEEEKDGFLEIPKGIKDGDSVRFSMKVVDGRANLLAENMSTGESVTKTLPDGEGAELVGTPQITMRLGEEDAFVIIPSKIGIFGEEMDRELGRFFEELANLALRLQQPDVMEHGAIRDGAMTQGSAEESKPEVEAETEVMNGTPETAAPEAEAGKLQTMGKGREAPISAEEYMPEFKEVVPVESGEATEAQQGAETHTDETAPEINAPGVAEEVEVPEIAGEEQKQLGAEIPESEILPKVKEDFMGLARAGEPELIAA